MKHGTDSPGVPTEVPRPKAVLVSVQLQGVTDADQQSSLRELKRLCETLGFATPGSRARWPSLIHSRPACKEGTVWT
jgi:hypothetical protein